jgi:hypothetical protein
MKMSILNLFIAVLMTGCVSVPPSDVNNVCNIFKQYPRWYNDAKDVEKRWRVPVPVLMAIIHQESKFNARAQPPRTKLFKVIPWRRPTTAYGYTQALNGTWALYIREHGNFFSSRNDFSEGLNFIGWYANEAYKRAGIPRNDPYKLYLAYHEGVGGYQRKTYLQKSWLLPVAHKVQARAQLYGMQLARCNRM